MIRFGAAAVAAFAMALAAPAQASVLDHLQLKIGASVISPDESAHISPIGGSVDISDETVPTLAIEYFFTDHISAELLCCMATHDVHAVNTGLGTLDLGEVSHFPPTLTVKYRWTNLGQFEPYVGAGVNYTIFFDENAPSGGPIQDINYGSSFGPALQVGFDYRLDEHWSINLDVRKVYINTDVTIDAGGLGIVRADVDIDPTITTLAVGYRF